MLNRREFLGVGTACAVTLLGAREVARSEGRFSRTYAPHFGMFRHHVGSDPIDQIKFFADEGFGALEDSGLRAKPAGLQARIGEELARQGMSMGLFVGMADFGRPTFASGCVDLRRGVLGELRSAAETARRVGGRYLAVVPGKSVPSLPRSVQLRHAVETLRFCADVCEARDLTLLLEPIDHGPGPSRLFLRTAEQAAELCRAVGRPSCRLLFDVYQHAVAGENLPRLLVQTSDVLGYVQLADAPGRKQPGTGEIDFQQVLTVLDANDYRGVLGMEHGNLLPGKAGERAVIEAYRALERWSYRPRAASRTADRQVATSSALISKTSIDAPIRAIGLKNGK
jgi:hydroxypyruvate isomerase